MLYIKNGIIKQRNQISILEIENGVERKIFFPSEEQILSDGWDIYVPPTPIPIITPVEEEYKNRVVELIRERYTIDDELAILRQRDTKKIEFDSYNVFVENCKKIAYDEIYNKENI